MQELNLLGFSHTSLGGYNRMKQINNHIPRNGDIIAINNAKGGYIGKVRSETEKVMIAEKVQQWQQFVYEAYEDNQFALRQKVSGLYLGFSDKFPQPVALAKSRQTHEMFNLTILSSGLLTINNYRGYHLSNKDGKLFWSFTISPSESWRFDIIQSNAVGCSSLERCLSLLSLPPSGTLITIHHIAEGYIGGVKDEQDCVRIVEHAGDLQQWVLEKKDGYCALKQKVTGLYLGRSQGFGQTVGVAGRWQSNQNLVMEEVSGGFCAIRNQMGHYMTKTNDTLMWTRSLTVEEHWKIEVAPATRLKINVIANKMSQGSFRQLYPVQGGLYAITHCSGGYIGGAHENHQQLSLVNSLAEESLWIFQKKDNKFGLRQRLTGLWLGHNSQLGDHIALAEKFLNCQSFTLQKYSDGIYGIKNQKKLFLSKLGNKILWVNNFGPEELWSFESPSITQVNLREMDGQMFAICHSSGGYIGGVKSGRLITVPKLDSWEFWVLQLRGDRFSLRQNISRKYLGVVNGLNERVGLADQVKAYELLRLEYVQNDMFTIRNNNNLYLTKRDEYVYWTDTCTKEEHWRFEHIDDLGDLITGSKATVFLSEAVFGHRLPPLISQIKGLMATRQFGSEIVKK